MNSYMCCIGSDEWNIYRYVATFIFANEIFKIFLSQAVIQVISLISCKLASHAGTLTVKKDTDFPVPSRSVTSRLGTGKTVTFTM